MAQPLLVQYLDKLDFAQERRGREQSFTCPKCHGLCKATVGKARRIKGGQRVRVYLSDPGCGIWVDIQLDQGALG